MPRRAGTQKGFIIRKGVVPPLQTLTPKLSDNDGRETLTGMIRGMKASDLEERFGYALDKAMQRGSVDDYRFRFAIGARGLPGWKELDYLVISRGGYYPVQIDDTTFIHRGTSGHDILTEQVILDGLRKMGIHPFPIERVTDRVLGNQKDADRFIRERFG